MRVADYIATRLADLGVDTAFMVTGGFAMHLNDALAAEPRIRKICCHHEQAAAYAAEGFAHISGRPALVQVTAGPGSINAMSGVFGAYTDSIPMVVISGQGKREVLRSTYGFEGMRFICDQEADIVSMVRPITKYAKEVLQPDRIVFELDKAYSIAIGGRPGPVWLEIPLDVQDVDIDAERLPHFRQVIYPNPDVSREAGSIIAALSNAERPLLAVGPDLAPRLRPLLRELVQRLGCPVVVGGAEDSLLNDNPLYAGRLGILGTRAGNIAVQNADAILFLGMRPYLGLVTYAWNKMASAAYKIFVDEDPHEFEKPCCIADHGIVCEPEFIIKELLGQVGQFDAIRLESWRAHCRKAVKELDVIAKPMRHVDADGAINPYWFAETLSGMLRDDDVIVAGNASSSIVPLQATEFKDTQHIFSNHGNGAMGYALPAAIGACMARPEKRVVCLEGDGSLMLNIQELQTVAQNKLPVVLIILNNGGYASIRQSQMSFAHQVGYDAQTGVSFPNFCALAGVFGLKSVQVEGVDFASQLELAMQTDGPILIDVRIDPEQGFEPKVASRRSINGPMVSSPPHEMSPLLPDEMLNRFYIRR